MDLLPSRSDKNKVSRRLRTLAQYQLALTAQHSGITDEYISDHYAQDLVQIYADVNQVVDEFLRQSGKPRDEIFKDVEPNDESSSSALLKNAVRKIDLNTVLKLVKTLSKVVEAYASYKNADENVKFYNHVKEQNRKRSRKKRRYVKRVINGEWVEYWESDSEVDESDQAIREKKKRDEVQKSSRDSLVDMETVKKAVAASVAVGAGLQTINYYSTLKETNTELIKVISSREGNDERINGDLTNVAPLNTGRLMAEDAEGIIMDLQQRGIEVPLRLRYTAREIMSLVKEMHETLVEIEDCYELRQEKQRTNIAITAATCLGALSFLLAPKSMLLRSTLFYVPLSASGVYFLLEKIFHFNVWKKSPQVTSARKNAVKLCNRFDMLWKERDIRKENISETAERIIQKRELERNPETLSGHLFPQTPQTAVHTGIRSTTQKARSRLREPILS